MPNPTITNTSFTFYQNVGNNVTEIALLTILMGSNSSQTLVLGNRGSAGLVWGTMSAFGAISVIKGCLSGASSGGVRALLGLRSNASDAAIGLELELARDSKSAARARRTLDNPLGVSCDAKKSTTENQLSKEHPASKDIYAFDRSTALLLEGLPSTSPGGGLSVYMYDSKPFFPIRDTGFQLLALALSLVKFLEVRHAWINGARFLAVVSAIPFSFFFATAFLVEYREILFEKQPAEIFHLDVIAGALPASKKIGGEKKIALGVRENPRSSRWWRLLWFIGVILYTASLIVTYYILRRQTRSFILTWVGYQVMWLSWRIILYHFKGDLEPMDDGMMVARQWEDLEPPLKARVFSLALAVARYQMHVHPRNPLAYRDDSFSPRQIASLLGKPNEVRSFYELPRDFNPTNSSGTKINVVAVIGDTALSSAGWISGSNMTAMELYDSCILVFSLPLSPAQSYFPPADSGSRTIAVPAVRVLSGVLKDSHGLGDEKWKPLFVPRGAGSRHEGLDLTWWYWIPCENGRWLQIQSKGLSVLGKRTAEVFGDEQLTTLLGAGTLNISMAHAREVKEVAKISQAAAESLLHLLA